MPILFTGVLSCGVGYTFQIIGQKSVNPALASLVMSLESVFAALTGWAVLGQVLSAREIVGCALIFAAIIIAQANFKPKA
jgi:drug/metabolite transporter (DMT)-like permease